MYHSTHLHHSMTSCVILLFSCSRSHSLTHRSGVRSRPGVSWVCLLLIVRDLSPSLGDEGACGLGLCDAADVWGLLLLPPKSAGWNVKAVHCMSCVIRVKPPASCIVCRLLTLNLTAAPICTPHKTWCGSHSCVL